MATPDTIATKNKAFSLKSPGLQTTWDSTTLGTLKECPRKYQLTYVEGWAPKNYNVHFLFGGIVHSALEVYDKAKAQGRTHGEATRAALGHTLAKTWFTTKHCPNCDRTFIPELQGACAKGDQCQAEPHSVGPWSSYDQYKTRDNLVRTVLWYLEHFKDDPASTLILANGKPAVELTFKIPLDNVTMEGEDLMLSGHMDRMVEFQGKLWVMDRKTTKGTLNSRYFDGYSPDNQMSLYSLAAGVVFETPVAGVVIDGMQVAINFTRFMRGFALRTPAQLDEFYTSTIQWIESAERYARERHWPMNETSCGNYGGCEFRGVCNKDPAVRSNFLSADFAERIWDPTVNR